MQFPTWTFVQALSREQVPAEAGVLTATENVIVAYRTVRDFMVLTTRRLILQDTQGLGKKRVRYCLPVESIFAWEVENEGFAGMASKVTLHTMLGDVHLELLRGLDVGTLERGLLIARDFD